MEDKIILVDTSILIDFYRKTDKSKSAWIALVRQGFEFAISAITKYEIYCGATPAQLVFWENVLQNMIVLSFDAATAKTAVDINNGLKRKRKQIDIADLFIASTAIIYQLPFATLNKKHFDRIDELKMVEWANPQKHPTSD
ncbi:MAG: type II toxin-antitoxin system VapC family toxin [Chitinophagaceae bacterium]|nr:type II toxin-antitoxin system VapC family toxin [Chitinophagaceae bacterium]